MGAHVSRRGSVASISGGANALAGKTVDELLSPPRHHRRSLASLGCDFFFILNHQSSMMAASNATAATTAKAMVGPVTRLDSAPELDWSGPSDGGAGARVACGPVVGAPVGGRELATNTPRMATVSTRETVNGWRCMTETSASQSVANDGSTESCTTMEPYVSLAQLIRKGMLDRVARRCDSCTICSSTSCSTAAEHGVSAVPDSVNVTVAQGIPPQAELFRDPIRSGTTTSHAIDGETVGASVGNALGVRDGPAVGLKVGDRLGRMLGILLGARVGRMVGAGDGPGVGAGVGIEVGR